MTLTNAKDPQTGYPADGYRLVQRWVWYNLDDWARNGFLFDPEFQLTDFGLNFANYSARVLPALPKTIFFQRGWTGYGEDCDISLWPDAADPGGGRLWMYQDGSGLGLLKGA